jgi:hypothetical protein
VKLHLGILPPAQLYFWDRVAGTVPADFVLYGGTAVALRFGHRQSVGFDFFTDRPFGFDDLAGAMPAILGSTVLQRGANMLTTSVQMPAGEVKLSFFGGLSFGMVGEPGQLRGKPAVASTLDLLATKLKTLHDRLEAKDYLDIEALLRSGLSLDDGIAAAQSLFGQALNPLDTAKAVAWFKDGGLDRILPPETRALLVAASARFDPALPPLPRRSSVLAPARRDPVA